MPDQPKDKSVKLFNSRDQLELLLRNVQELMLEAVQNEARRAKVSPLLDQCIDYMAKIAEKNTEAVNIASSLGQEAVVKEAEAWMGEVTKRCTSATSVARNYIDKVKLEKTQRYQLASGSLHSFTTASLTSTEIQRRAKAASLKREEAERQKNEKIRLLKLKHEEDLKIRLAHMELEEQKVRAQARRELDDLVEKELEKVNDLIIEESFYDNFNPNIRSKELGSGLSISEKSARTQNWVDKSHPESGANIPEVQCELDDKEPCDLGNDRTQNLCSNSAAGLPANGAADVEGKHTDSEFQQPSCSLLQSRFATPQLNNRSMPLIHEKTQYMDIKGGTGDRNSPRLAPKKQIFFENDYNTVMCARSNTSHTSTATYVATSSGKSASIPNPLLDSKTVRATPFYSLSSRLQPRTSLVVNSPANPLYVPNYLHFDTVDQQQPIYTPQSNFQYDFQYQARQPDYTTQACDIQQNLRSNPTIQETSVTFHNNYQPVSTPQSQSHDPYVTPQQFYQQQCYPQQPLDYQPHVQQPNNQYSLWMKELAEAITTNKKGPLPEWKLSTFDGNPLQWHEWFGQFSSAVDSADLSNDVKLTYLKTLVKGKAQSAIAEFAYSGAMYEDALRKLRRKFGNPHAIVNAHLDKLNNHAPVKMHNSESVINYSQVISNLVGIFRSLGYEADLRSASLLNVAISKLPPNLKEQWAMFVVRKEYTQANLIDFDKWLQQKADAHEQMQATIPLSMRNNKHESPSAVRTKTSTKTFAVHTNQQEKPKVGMQSKSVDTCIVCKQTHLIYHCATFKKKTPTDRAKFIAEHKLCFSCFKPNHSYRECPRSRNCPKENCKSTHNVLLHGAERVFSNRRKAESSGNSAAVEPVPQGSEIDYATIEETNSSSAIANLKGLLQVLEVQISSPCKTVTAFAMCDTGSSHSWISKRLAKELQLSGEKQQLSLTGINAVTTLEAEQVEISVRSIDRDFDQTFVVKPFTKDRVNVGSDVVDLRRLKSVFPHIEQLPDSTLYYQKVELLLGQDCFDCIRPLEYVDKDSQSPVAVRLPIGWVLSGPLPLQHSGTSCSHSSNIDNCELAAQIKSWYDIESYGTYKTVDPRSADDRKADQILESSTYHDGTRYVVGMLWADENGLLPNNYYSAVAQLKSLEKRFSKDPELKAKYQKTIDEDLMKGYVIKLSEQEINKSISPRRWYLPHHPVVNPNKPGKVRRVLNGAAKFQGSSLNESLLIGPDLLSSLFGVLVRFRQYAFAISADIEGMFLQVGVLPQDQESLRFLWREDPISKIDVFQYTRHIFGAKDSPTCANYALKRTAKDNVSTYPAAAQAVEECFYMDDYLDSRPSAEELQTVAKDLVEMLKLGGFKLTKFVSNNPDTITKLNESDKNAVNDVVSTPEISTHVLGLKWNNVEDTLVVSRGVHSQLKEPVTQRLILSCVSSVFDPIGLVAPYVVKCRLILKSIWKTIGQCWDEKLPDDLVKCFSAWHTDLPKLGEVCVHRSYFDFTFDHVELHVFGDSSIDIFGAVAYLRAKPVGSSGPYSISFVLGKARVAPMKPLSIPKLELQAALLAARLKKQLENWLSVEITESFLWTDSTTVVQWLQNAARKQPVFIANRISEILELSTIDQWRHVEGKLNPADDVTRGLTTEELAVSRWVNGPEFLLSDGWMNQPVLPSLVLPSSIDNEISETVSAVSNKNPFKFPWERFSSYNRMVRVAAYILRCLPRKRRYSSITTECNVSIDASEFRYAEHRLQYLAQHESFAAEIEALKGNDSVPKGSRIAAFSPFIGTDQLLRSYGRIRHLTEVTYNTKHPIMLDGRHPYVQLLLSNLHHANYHQGVEYLCAQVQTQLAVLNLRRQLRSIKARCNYCRKVRAQAVNPMMSDLPKERLGYRQPAFAYCGVDYFGPMYVSIRRSTEKRWGFLFTCLTTRAVHIEVVGGLDTSSCIMALQRFISRRGQPLVIWSDNGTNFIGSERELRENFKKWNKTDIVSSFAHRGITWKFNPPAAPHHGGVWERMVGSCKRVFYAILGSRRLKDDVLATTFCLVEQILNGRPLTPVSTDPNDLEAITPNHFLLGRASVSLPVGLVNEVGIDHKSSLKRAEAYADIIWKRWLTEYVPSLNVRSKWRSDPSQVLRNGDLVWIIDPTLPRGHYQLARVERLHFGKDDVARSALLRTPSSMITRPLTKLVPVLPEALSQAEDVAERD